MEQTFFDSQEFSEIKIFQIDKDFYELKNKGSNESIIQYIVDEHRIKVDDIDKIGEAIPRVEYDDVIYYSYVYNEPIQDSYWQSFLPSRISQNHNFEIQKISFVLFAAIRGEIFAIMGGGGIRVIKRYLNHRFGLEFFEYLTIPGEDIVSSITTRGISGRLTEQTETYRSGQTLLDSLNFVEIPTKINLRLREDLKNTVFDFIAFENDIIYLEIGSYFLIKHRINFKSLHQLFRKINEIHRVHSPNALSSFVKVQDPDLVENQFKTILLNDLREDMNNHFAPNRGQNPRKLDIDFIHPSRMREFYECNRYELKVKNAKKLFFETNNRQKLYKEGLRYLYDNLENRNDQFEFSTVILGMRVYGYRDTKLKTHAMFLQHITCEIKYENRPVFQIDSNWYKVKDDFVSSVNERCINLFEKNLLRTNPLHIAWDSSIKDEGSYNNEYKDLENFYVFDKVIPDNIEFCDIMFEDEESIYLIHVKDGFDAKIRDVSNQILISANRFWNDKNSGSQEYLKGIIDSYNRNRTPNIDKEEFLEKFNSSKEIIYVMAFKTNKGGYSIQDKIRQSRSNIAKYSLVQCSQDMTALYNLKIIDIADITGTNISSPQITGIVEQG